MPTPPHAPRSAHAPRTALRGPTRPGTARTHAPTHRPVPPGLAAIYVRISQDRNGAGLGVDRQERECRPLAARRGYPPERIVLYDDNDKSASNGRRPGYERLLADIASGRVTYVVAWHPDRLHRRMDELERWIDAINAAAVDVETVKGGTVDFTTPTGRMVARQLGAIARYESEHKSERLTSKHQQLAAAGKRSGGGLRPFGYDRTGLKLVPEEARVIREAARRVLRGESLRSIATDLGERGVRGTLGKPFTTSSLRHVLVSARISGRREHRVRAQSVNGRGAGLRVGTITAKAEWPRIITPEDSDKLRRSFADPARRRRPGDSIRRYVLTGLVTCGKCKAPLQARAQGPDRPEYRCPSLPGVAGRGCVRVNAEPVEELVLRGVVKKVATRRSTAALIRQHTAGAAEAERELNAVDALLADLAARWANGRVTSAEWDAARAPLDVRRIAAEEALADMDGTAVLADVPKPLTYEALIAMPVSRQRAIVQTIVRGIAVHPVRVRGGGFDPERVRIRWFDDRPTRPPTLRQRRAAILAEQRPQVRRRR
jgi:DNA invertase Pin-like site-specific DNA recombinase